MRPRRSSTMGGMNAFGQPVYDSPTSYRPSYANPFVSSSENVNRRGMGKKRSNESAEHEDEVDERAPLISSSARAKSSGASIGYSAFGGDGQVPAKPSLRRQSSKSSSRSRHKNTIFDKQPAATFPTHNEDYNVNHPPSMPGSPSLGASNRGMSFGDLLVRDEFSPARASPREDDDISESAIDYNPRSPRDSTPKDNLQRRHTITLQAQDDVCFPVEGMSELGDDDMNPQNSGAYRSPRRRRPKWPDLGILEDWSRVEKEGRSDERRSKAITEPHLIGGRLRPTHKGWHRAEDDAPYRFTYFNEEFQSTIHSQTISELVQPGGGFAELFIPDRPVLSDSESDDEDDDENTRHGRDDSYIHHVPGLNGDSRAPTRQSSVIDNGLPEYSSGSMRRATSPLRSEVGGTEPIRPGREKIDSVETASTATPVGIKSPLSTRSPPPREEKPKRYGERPTWWLDVLSPTQAEMQVISKAFGIHPLTSEDILMQEPREKVELFRNYYFVNYRSFEQDMHNEDFLEPINMYVVVFREGVISFHFSMTPHPANVRRRIRQLKDYLILSSDWISYAIIDDITDVFAPLIQNIEDEVDNIDDAILMLHSPSEEEKKNNKDRDNEKRTDSGDGTTGESGGDMLRRVGDCRKKVMGLYRLLGNKADVIKGFAKRCNEQWDVAPRSEIGLYLGDIQDHIVTMTGNLSHYEK
jgi:magnesium transporter